jgi:hypothetical protein
LVEALLEEQTAEIKRLQEEIERLEIAEALQKKLISANTKNSPQ